MARNLSKALIGSTCLTLSAAGPAVAGPFLESSAPGGDFPNIRAAAYGLPLGTDTVFGGNGGANLDDDFFTFQNVLSGNYIFTLNFCCTADIFVGPAVTPTYSN